MRNNNYLGKFFAVGVFGLATMAFAEQSAATTLYTFTADGSGGDHGIGPWGTVEVTSSGSDLFFSAEFSPNVFVNRGSHYSFTFNLSSTSGTVAGITHGGQGSAAFTQVAGTSFSNTSFSGFNYAINCSTTSGDAVTGANACGSWLKFTVQNAGSIIASGGNPSIFFAADIYDIVNGKTGTVGATFTRDCGPPGAGCAVGAVGEVPLPAALPLFTSAVAAAGGFGFWRRKRAARGRRASPEN